MFSWSFKWLWFQCLIAAAGLFLLGHMALPGPQSLAIVSGRVESVRVVSRKGIGSSNELTVSSADGSQHRVLIVRDDSINAAVQHLVGRDITAGVNWSSVAVEFKASGDPGGLAETVHASAARSQTIYNTLGWVALVIGLSLAAVMIAREIRSISDE